MNKDIDLDFGDIEGGKKLSIPTVAPVVKAPVAPLVALTGITLALAKGKNVWKAVDLALVEPAEFMLWLARYYPILDKATATLATFVDVSARVRMFEYVVNFHKAGNALFPRSSKLVRKE